jgi:hypothetical protein
LSSDVVIEPGTLADSSVADQDYLELESFWCKAFALVVCICRHGCSSRLGTVLRWLPLEQTAVLDFCSSSSSNQRASGCGTARHRWIGTVGTVQLQQLHEGLVPVALCHMVCSVTQPAVHSMMHWPAPQHTVRRNQHAVFTADKRTHAVTGAYLHNIRSSPPCSSSTRPLLT